MPLKRWRSTQTIQGNGKSIPHYAAQSGAVEAMRYVIYVLGVNTREINNNGGNAFHWAVKSGSMKAVRLFINSITIVIYNSIYVILETVLLFGMWITRITPAQLKGYLQSLLKN
ncbi:ankyrin repeat domain-containing protein [Coxiella endosymbiont of Ornithodoros maritimus]|uniref:ankyrin repeat domain-containing protein n=1 Tax=Coxiella endosymbiont of Ornithodoros maritimus TaxID=1656172 RepID=UPI002B4001A1|nr:ankyrin repeat domain-containing protein [Coxiella endosymbiont of Ornithodoros maritimus]